MKLKFVSFRSPSDDFSVIKVRVGSLYAGQGGHLRTIEEVHKHPNYTGLTNSLSVALLKLNESPSSGLFGVVRLSSAIPKSDSKVNLYGFDQVQKEKDSLKTLRLTVQSSSLCHKLIGVMRLFPESSFCVTAATNKMFSATCWGDKGAPVVQSDNLKLIGVLLSPGGCHDRDLNRKSPEVVAPISRFIGWISAIVGQKRSVDFLE